MYPSSFCKDRLGPVAGADRVGLAAALGEPIEPFGANDADDVGEVLAPRARPALYRQQAIKLGEPDRPLGQRMADPCPRCELVEAPIAGTMGQPFVGDHLQNGKLARGEACGEARRQRSCRCMLAPP